MTREQVLRQAYDQGFAEAWEKCAKPRYVREAIRLLLKKHPSASRSAERILKATVPTGKTRAVGVPLGRGAEGRVSLSYTGGAGFTANKTHPAPAKYLDNMGNISIAVQATPASHVPAALKGELLQQHSQFFPKIHQIHPRGWIMERLHPHGLSEDNVFRRLRSIKRHVNRKRVPGALTSNDPILKHKGSHYLLDDMAPDGSNIMRTNSGRIVISDPLIERLKHPPTPSFDAEMTKSIPKSLPGKPAAGAGSDMFQAIIASLGGRG